MLQFRRNGALLASLIVLAVLASACSTSGSIDRNVDGGVNDGGADGGMLDSDFDGVPDDEDPCSTTLVDAIQLMPGCSATDIIQDETHLVASIDDGIEEIRSIANVPPAILAGLDEARVALGVAVRAFVDDDPCAGVPGFEMVVDLINGAHMEMQDFLFELETTIPEYPVGAIFPDDVPAEASLYLIWTLHSAKLHHVMEDAMEASSLVSEICDQKMGTTMVEGVVQSIRDDLRVAVLRSGEVIFLGPNIVEEGEHRMGEGREVSIEATQLSDGILGTRMTTKASPFALLPGHLTYDKCLQLRVTLRGDIAGPDPLPLDGFRHDDGYYDFDRGTSIGAESRGCPTEDDLKGAGPGGVDMKFIYSFHLQLTYTEGLGQPRTRLMAFEHGDVNKPLREPILFPPNIDPAEPATLYITKRVTTCVVDPNLPQLGRYNPQNGEIGPAEPQWNCSDDMLLEFDSPTVYVRLPGYNCEVGYDDTVFTLEDDEPTTWQPASVDRVVPGDGLPTPANFEATGPKLVNGAPVAGSTITPNEPFAIYGNFSGKIWDSGLVAPHITGTRNGQPFTYLCSTPDLVRDGIDTIVQIGPPPEGACAFYRLPYPNGTSVHVNQGNGGTASHFVNDTQEWALDLSGQMGDPLVAARGGTVARVVNGITISCGGCGSDPGQDPCPPNCPAYGNHVAVQHQGGEVSWYMHLVSSGLQEGALIKRGDPIGALGTTGRSTGPHLHFQATATVLDGDGKTNWQTVPIRYEIDGYCEVPIEGQTYVSTNEPN
jgi:hypothetical protein